MPTALATVAVLLACLSGLAVSASSVAAPGAATDSRTAPARGTVVRNRLAAEPASLALTPAISIVIDDIGNDWPEGRAAVDLPGPVTCAFLPHTPYAARLARRAHARAKQVMLHLPMESIDDRPLGPGGLTVTMGKPQFLRTLRADIDSIPYVSGVNNHMGSLLTQQPTQMRWLMHDLLYHGRLFFLDSRTTAQTVAQRAAMNNGLATTRRNVFLDNVQQPQAVRRRVEQLIELARRHGTALGIGHPHPVTLAVLAEMLPTLEQRGIRLVPVSKLIQLKHERRIRLWQASLSP